MRKTLEKYYGKRVKIKAIYDGAPHKHEETGIKFDEKLQDYPAYRDNTEFSETSEESKLPYRSPIFYPEIASCLINIRGIDKYTDIKEDHVNIQQDLGCLYDLKKGDEIKLECLVARYPKKQGYEYCFGCVERILE